MVEQQNNDAASKAHREAYDIDEGIPLVAQKIANGNFEIVCEHRYSREWDDDITKSKAGARGSKNRCSAACCYVLSALPSYSYLSDSTGLVRAAFIALEATVRNTIMHAATPAKAKETHPMDIRYAKLSSQASIAT